LESLVPDYVDELPVCPLDGAQHFSADYRPGSVCCRSCREQALQGTSPAYWKYVGGIGTVLVEIASDGSQIMTTVNKQVLDGSRERI